MNQNALKVIEQVKKTVIGKDDCIIKTMTAILAGGHILIEDIPGVGKTTLALAFSKAMQLSCQRMQFTPDVLPADITGFSVYQKETDSFAYQPGPIMCNLFLADEINRTSPKTQSALLEVMEEGQVTVDGVTRSVPSPFFVIATQNPSGSAGTQLLPESQLDRFMIRMSIGYPDIKNEISIVKGKRGLDPTASLEPVISNKDLIQMQKESQDIFIHDSLYEYIGLIVSETRNHSLAELGVSPRGTIALAKMSMAYAYLMGRDYVLPDDILFVAPATLLHRIVLNGKARASHVTCEGLLEGILDKVKKPSIRKE